MIYLDHNATTPVDPEVFEAMQPYLGTRYGNPSSLHAAGRESRAGVEDAREKVARLISASPEEIVFTGCGSESDNYAIKGVASALRARGNHLITSQVEHHAVLHPCQYLAERGFEATFLPVDGQGAVDPQSVRKAITDRTILITVMHSNNEVGTLQPLEEIGLIARERGVLLHTDAIQSLGKVRLDVGTLFVDLMSLSAHKLYGPKGVGALYIRKGTRIDPLIHGGGHESNRRAGTENVAGIVGFGKACDLGMERMERESQRLTQLRERLWDGLRARLKKVYLNGHPTERLPGTLSVCFAGVEGESLLVNLDLKGICVSSGSACTSGSTEPSHVLKAMGVKSELAQGSLRMSIGKQNTEKEIDETINVLVEVVARLRAMSPTWRD
jgi:cysteine desulfurase